MALSDDEETTGVFAHPGQISKRTRVTLDDVSSDDEDDSDIWLKSGKERKAAIAERAERKKAEEQQQQKQQKQQRSNAGGSSQEPPPGVEAVDVDAEPPPSARSKRRADRKSAVTLSPDSPGAVAVEAEAAAQRARQNSQLHKMRSTFQLPDDDDDVVAVGGPGGGRAAGGSSAAGRSNMAGVHAGKVWLHVHSDGALPALLSCASDLPLTSFVSRVAESVALDASRICLFRGKGGGDSWSAGDALDMSRTPSQLGLDPSTHWHIWAEERAEATITLKFRKVAEGNSDVELKVVPTATFAQIVLKYCAAHAKGHTPQQVKFSFDGDVIKPSDTPASLEMEMDDLVEVQLK